MKLQYFKFLRCDSTLTPLLDIGADDEAHSSVDSSVPVAKQQCSWQPPPSQLRHTQRVMYVPLALITSDVTPIDGKEYKYLLYTKVINEEIYGSFLHNLHKQYPHLRGELKPVETWEELCDAIEAAIKQAREEGVSRMVFSIIGHGERGWKNIITRNKLWSSSKVGRAYLSMFYREFSWLEFPEEGKNVPTYLLLYHIRKMAKKYGTVDTHVLLFMCHTYLIGAELNINTDRFSFNVYHSSSKDRPRGRLILGKPLNGSVYKSNDQQVVITGLPNPDATKHSGMDIMRANIEKNLSGERPFEDDGYVPVPSQRDKPTEPEKKDLPNVKLDSDQHATPIGEDKEDYWGVSQPN